MYCLLAVTSYSRDLRFKISLVPKSYNDLPNASYTFYVKAKDQAENIDPFPASRSFTVNVQNPNHDPELTRCRG